MSPALFWGVAAVLVVAAVVDWFTREIPDVFPLLLLAVAIGACAAGLGPPRSVWPESPWLALVLGAGLGFGVGALLFALGGFGGGDAKLLAGLGAVLGPVPLCVVLAYIAVLGGLLAVIGRLRRDPEVAYGPAIAAGYLVAYLVSWLGV